MLEAFGPWWPLIVVAQVIAIIEITAYFTAPRWLQLISRLPLGGADLLPDRLDPIALQGFRGADDHVTYEVVDDEVVFRRTLGFWKRPYASCRLSMDENGRVSAAWAPFPAVFWLLFPLVWPALGWEAWVVLPFVGVAAFNIGASAYTARYTMLPRVVMALQNHVATAARGTAR